MDYVSKEELQELVSDHEAPCVSVLLPTDRSGDGTRQGSIRLKNLLSRAEDLLVEHGLRGPEARKILSSAAALVDDDYFWQYQSDGLALYIAPGYFRRYRVPLDLKETAHVGPRFHVRPLLPLFAADGRFFVLAISQKEVRLLQCTHHTVGEIELEDVPHGIAEALQYDDFEKQLQYHTGTSSPPAAAPATKPQGRSGAPKDGRRAAMFHGQGSVKDTEKDALLRYFRQVDEGVSKALNGDTAPLVLAGVDYLFPLYRDANTYPQLFEEGAVTGNPDRRSDGKLRDQAWEAVRHLFEKEREKVRGRYANLQGTGLTSAEIEQIVRSAQQGKVEALLLANGGEHWGRFDESSGNVRFVEEPEAGAEDLVNLAAILCIRHRGTVYSLDTEEVPDGKSVVALLRR